jgi:uncharacterized protein (TIGR03083 family)
VVAAAGTGSPRVSTLDRPTADRLAVTEYERFAGLLADLAADEWRTPTVCTAWDVRAVAAHCLGMAEMAASTVEGVRQNAKAARRSSRRGEEFIDALTGLQVDEHAELTGREIAARFAEVGPGAARARARTPGMIRRVRMPGESFPGDVPWTMGYLRETILTRDPWMHRIDIADAVGRPMTLTAEHDGVIVDDVVREWAARHRQPCTLTLDGPAGGRWTFGDGGPDLSVDALEFSRRLSGRAPADGPFATQVPF